MDKYKDLLKIMNKRFSNTKLNDGIDLLYPGSKKLGIIRSCDIYGQPISMNFENKQTHQTIFGGLITILFIGGFGIFFLVSMLDTSQYYRKD